MHQRLLDISREKTEAIKKADNDALVKLLTKERQLVEEVERKENERIAAVDAFFQAQNIAPEEKTVSEILKYITSETAREQFEKATTKLIEVIVQLREVEQLNQGLLQQSMQFVQLTLSMLQPETKTINYGKQHKQQQTKKNLSVFDSKA